MKKSIITLITITFALLVGTKAEAQQDPNFTLYNFNMNIINPAFAGIKETPELNLVYRNQFLGIDDAPRTISMAYSKPMGKNLGLGISVINDRVFVLTETDIAIDVSYKIQIGEATNMYFGLKAGGGFVNIDLTKANNSGLDQLFNQNQSFFNPHIGAGLNIQNEKFYISISTPNFLRGDRYEKQGNRPSAAVDQAHFYMGGGYHIAINDNLLLTPRFMMRSVQGAPTSYDIGSSLEINKKFTAGVNLRVDETVSAYGLFQVIDKLKFGAAYDVTTMDASIINDNGSLELILKYQF
ncbi:type IX secretion system membrane protein PorP/SprF [Pseudotenacibaculum sp. MALMAid0570]|uniref:PorP/SprF family type IX secretion system membrane protein n=1 Tax=Pseudotenacibaculum sp. MALMAid0570 TaxID=3143938 RepID=UPI0032DEF701